MNIWGGADQSSQVLEALLATDDIVALAESGKADDLSILFDQIEHVQESRDAAITSHGLEIAREERRLRQIGNKFQTLNSRVESSGKG